LVVSESPAHNARMRDGIWPGRSRDVWLAVQQDARRRKVNSALRILQKAYAIAIAVGLLNCLLFLAGAFYFGGHALNGRVEQGRYYLFGLYHCIKGYREVSQAVFNYSRWHTDSMLTTWALMLVASVAHRLIDKRILD
jgi:hypothetical protein